MTPIGPRLAFLFVAGAFLLSFPILAIFNRPILLGGIPILYLYLFGVWIVGIVGVFLVVRTQAARDPGSAPVPPRESVAAREGESRRC
jgi:hypothetical protein